MTADHPTGLIQEAILILAGHPSQLTTTSIQPATFHPAAANSLSLLTTIAALYHSIATFIAQKQPSSGTPHASPAIAALRASLASELAAYQDLLIQLEFKLLSHHPDLVPADLNQRPSPPLTAVLAQVIHWLPIFQTLSTLIDQLATQPSWTSPELIQLIYPHSLTGSPQLAQIFARLQAAVEQVWLDGFRAFVIYGQTPAEQHSTTPLPLNDLFYAHRPPANNALAQSTPQQSLRFSFREHGLPQLPLLQPIDQLNQFIQQICHALSILKLLIHPNAEPRASSSKLPHLHSHTKIILPTELQSQLRLALQSIDSLSHPRFRIAIKNVQEILSNYLFSTYLTPEILSSTLGTLTDVFFLRHSTFAGNLVEGMIRLKTRRAGMGGGEAPRIRRLASLSERELDVVLLKAGISTELGEDPAGRQLDLDGFSFGLLGIDEHGGSQESARTGASLIERTFSQSILNRAQPVLLTYAPRPGLSLFLTQPICESYSTIHSCLFAFLIAQQSFKDSWRELTQKERLRTRLEGSPRARTLGRIGARHAQEIERVAFEGLRRMGWFVNLMVDHFFQDVIEQSIQLLSKEINVHYQHASTGKGEFSEEGEEGGERPKGRGTSADFFKIHASFLGLVETGLGLKNARSSAIMKDLLSCCAGFLLDLESWSFELAAGGGVRGEIPATTTVLVERELRLTKALDSFNALIRQLIVELRTDDARPLADPSLPTSSASAFRRTCLDSLLLKFDFNLWFSSPL
ncbi:hypothetical protein PtA15_1A951 [Puccinia triticina]|uniref:Spindle pole body component n=1 Tax=Puccinia triticina TaxID=208348 RepID=A0ABY7CA99_9BASI|nr:uncharacterized protein PtA15_1A951 [Puccinia triticina]WAQ81609.1 hypothetical protein PtA15_1A951 [Puccinia triticina]WAR52496.1 hypothetical protein PtB15_1B938 [Puccinia triticina]